MLARGRLSGAQRERVLVGALRQARWSTRKRWGLVATAAVIPLAAAVALFLRAPADPVALEAGGTFRAKGAAGPRAGARCPGRPAGECHAGDRLIFEVDAVAQPGFFAAYADCASGERVWYFPTPEGRLPELLPRDHAVLSEAARIGAEHGIGSCTLHLFLLDRSASRSDLVDGAARNAAIASVSLEVKP